MDLCTVTKVKSRLSIPVSTTEYDDEIQDIITSVSAKIETYLGRTVEINASGTTEYFDVNVRDERYSLKAYPVTSITGVWNDTDRAFGSSTAVDTDSYTTHNEIGILCVDWWAVLSGVKVLKVTYVGGMATETSAFVSTYADIADACVRQCCYVFNSRRHIGMQGVNAVTGGVSLITGVELLEDVAADLDRHRRMYL